jgi:hypothetical protein
VVAAVVLIIQAVVELVVLEQAQILYLQPLHMQLL